MKDYVSILAVLSMLPIALISPVLENVLYRPHPFIDLGRVALDESGRW
jgi:hypothetical protein